MRLLDQEGVSYKALSFPYDESDFDGVLVAKHLDLPCSQVYKTLMVEGGKDKAAVFCLPVDKVLDLKIAATLLKEKKVALYPVVNLQALTGYVRGGCSPIAMKKHFPTFFHEAMMEEPLVAVSGGARGIQIQLNPQDLLRVVNGQLANLLSA